MNLESLDINLPIHGVGVDGRDQSPVDATGSFPGETLVSTLCRMDLRNHAHRKRNGAGFSSTGTTPCFVSSSTHASRCGTTLRVETFAIFTQLQPSPHMISPTPQKRARLSPALLRNVRIMKTMHKSLRITSCFSNEGQLCCTSAHPEVEKPRESVAVQWHSCGK